MTGRRGGRWEVVPVGPDRWPDLVRLFGRSGAHGGCWCVFWRSRRDVWAAATADQNRARLRRLVRKGVEPGLLGYQDDEPVAWVSLGPREDFPTLETSRLLARVDDRAVWSIVCFFIRRDRRRAGWMRRLLKAAAAYAAEHGATLLEGYPVECGARELTGYAGYTGIASTYRAAGFREVARPRADRPIMRRAVRRASTDR